MPSPKDLIKALDDLDKEKQIDETFDLFRRWGVTWHVREYRNRDPNEPNWECAVSSDVSFVGEMREVIEGKTFNVYYGSTRYEAVIRASIAIWTNRHIRNMPTVQKRNINWPEYRRCSNDCYVIVIDKKCHCGAVQYNLAINACKEAVETADKKL